MTRNIVTIIVAGLLAVPPALAAEDNFAINVTVSGADPLVGQVLFSLFDSSENYMEVPLVNASEDVDGDGKAFATFGKQAPGEYAIAVVYDQNGNGKLDTGLFRIPKEKIGYSNNAKGKFGPAKWDYTRFMVTDADVNIDIQLANARRDQ